MTPWTVARQAPLSSAVSQRVLRLMSIQLVMLANHVILCRSLLLLPSIFPSIRVLSNESALCLRCPKHWSFSFSISPSNEYSGLISFRIDWFDFLAVQGILRSLLQHQNSLENINSLALSFPYIQLSHPYVTIGKTIASTIHIFVGKILPLIFNTLSRFVIAFPPRWQWLLISWLQCFLKPRK